MAGTDTVIVGGTTAEEQVIELAVQVSPSFTTQPGDGLIGLAFKSLNTGIYLLYLLGTSSNLL